MPWIFGASLGALDPHAFEGQLGADHANAVAFCVLDGQPFDARAAGPFDQDATAGRWLDADRGGAGAEQVHARLEL